MNEEKVWYYPKELIIRWETKFGIRIKENTLAVWRSKKMAKGPRYTILLGKARYHITDILVYEKLMTKTRI